MIVLHLFNQMLAVSTALDIHYETIFKDDHEFLAHIFIAYLTFDDPPMYVHHFGQVQCLEKHSQS